MAEITYVVNDLNKNKAGELEFTIYIVTTHRKFFEASAVQAAHDEEATSVRERDMLNGLEEVSGTC